VITFEAEENGAPSILVHSVVISGRLEWFSEGLIIKRYLDAGARNEIRKGIFCSCDLVLTVAVAFRLHRHVKMTNSPHILFFVALSSKISGTDDAAQVEDGSGGGPSPVTVSQGPFTVVEQNKKSDIFFSLSFCMPLEYGTSLLLLLLTSHLLSNRIHSSRPPFSLALIQ
jgi:hypothetical protein